MASRDVVAHLASSCDAIYVVFGEDAAQLTNDDFVVRTHELSRVFGELALKLRVHAGDGADGPLAIIESVLREAVANDETGAMALFAFVVLVGPRLLVTTHDARVALDARGALSDVIDKLAHTLVREIRCTAEVVRALSEGDQEWLEAARGLTTRLEASGNADSFRLFA